MNQSTDSRNRPFEIALPLAENMDQAIGEATTVMGAMITELVRRSLRGGVLKIGEQLEGYVSETVETTLAERAPALEQAAITAAENTAHETAARIATQEVEALENRTGEVTRALALQIEETEERTRRSTTEVVETLSGRIEETTAATTQKLTGRLESTAQQLHGRIEEVDRRADATTRETARELTGQIDEAARRVSEAMHSEISQRVQELLDRSRKGGAAMKTRMKHMEATIHNLHKELTALHQLNQSLDARLAELERPRGLRALWAKLFGRKKK